jgi:hypothetical protein
MIRLEPEGIKALFKAFVIDSRDNSFFIMIGVEAGLADAESNSARFTLRA